MSRRLAALVALALVLGLATPAPALPATPTRLVLPHGLVAYVLPRHDQPIVAMQLGLRAGTMEEGPDEVGVAAMTASLLTRGTASMSAAAIATRIDDLGGGFEVTATPEHAELRVQVLKQDWPLALELAGQVLAHPTFDAAEVDKVRTLEAGMLASSLDEPTDLARLAGWQALYGHGPLGRPAVGGQAALARLTPAMLARFHQLHYQPAQAVLVVVGDVTPAEVQARVVPALAGWLPTGPVARPRLPELATSHGATLVPLDVSQANIHVTYPAVGRRDPRYYPMLVATQILGAGYQSRLYKKVREELGLAYHARAQLHAYGSAGAVAIEIQTKQASTRLALDTTFAQVEDLRQHPVSAAELAGVKNYLIGKFPRMQETNEDCAAALLELALDGLPPSELGRFPGRVAQVTARQVQEAARTYLAPARRMVTVAGPAGALMPLLARYGAVQRVEPRALIR